MRPRVASCGTLTGERGLLCSCWVQINKKCLYQAHMSLALQLSIMLIQ
jgi:hypothetical protein